MFCMPVSEGKVATLGVPVGRQVPPDVLVPIGAFGWDTELSIEDLVLVHIEEGDELGRCRILDSGELGKARYGAPEKSIRSPVDRLTHVVTADSRLIRQRSVVLL